MFYQLKNTLVAAMLLPLALGCKREGLTAAVTEPTAQHKVQQWLNAQPTTTGATSRAAGRAIPKNTLQWGQAQYSKKTATHFIPATLLQEGKGNPYVRAGLVATEDAQGQIRAGHYMVAVSKRTTMGDAAAQYYNLARLYQPEPQEQPTGFSGAVLYYNAAGQPTVGRVYNHGQVQQGATAVLAAKPTPVDSEANKVPRNCDGPGSEGCIDWYLQTYVNGQLVEEEYQFTTCCNSFGGGGAITNDEGPCASECQEFGAMTNQISGYENPVITVVSSNPLPSSIANPETTRVARVIKMDFYKLDFFLGFYARFSAYYHGVAYKNNANETNWKWESLGHVPPSNAGDYHTEGEVPACFSVKPSYNATPISYSGDRRFAYIGYNFNVKAYFNCPISMEVHNHPGSAANVQINANREN